MKISVGILSLLALSWVIPDHIPPWFMIHTEIPAFAASGICLFACLRWNRMQYIAVPCSVFGFGLLLCTVMFQWMLGIIVYAGDAWVAVAYIVLIASGCLWGYQWAGQAGSTSVLTTIAYFFITIGLITIFQLLAQRLKIEEVFNGWVVNGIPDERPRANIGQPNQAATTIMLAVVATALLYARNNISLPVAGALELLFLLGVSFTQSRTPLISGAVLAGSLVCFHIRKRVNHRLVLALFILLLVGMLGVYFWSVNRTSMLAPELMATDPRILIWWQLIAAIWEHPWVGWGWLQVASAQQFGAIQFPGNVPVNYSHNVIMDAFVMLGMPISSGLLLLFFLWIKARWPRLLKSPDVIWAGALTIPFFIHSLLELPHAYAYFLFPVAILIGVIDACTEEKSTHVLRLSSRWTAYLSSMWVALLLVMGHEYFRIEEDFRVSRFENRGIGLTNSLHQKQDVLFFTQLEALMHAAQVQITPQMNLDEIEALKRVAKRYTSSLLELRAAKALALNDRPDEAIERMQVIRNLFAVDVYTDAKREFATIQKK